MLTIPALRWGKPYKSLETQDIYHFDTGEPIAKLSTVNGGMLQLDMRKATAARAARNAQVRRRFASGCPMGDDSP